MTRREFSTKTREDAERRANGLCECGLCGGLPLAGRKIEFHHHKEAESDGDNSLGNCRVVRADPCHKILTGQFKARCGKADKVRRANNGVRRPTAAPIPQPPKQDKSPRDKLPVPPPRALFEKA